MIKNALDTRKSTEKDRYLVFSLCEEQYAIPLLKVKEVIGMPTITPVPHAPPHFKGVMNLRGQIISVIDLRVKFRMSRADFTPETAIIVLDFASVVLGVIVDSVASVLAALESELAEVPAIESHLPPGCITGVYRKSERLTFLIDIERAVGLAELKNHLSARPKVA